MRRLLVLLIAATALIASACGAVTPYAAIVNGERLPQRDLDRELKAIRNNKAFSEAIQGQGLQIEGTTKNTFDMAFVSRVLTRRIFFELIHQEVERRKLKISAADLRAARGDAIQSFGGEDTVKDFPEWYIESATRTTAEIAALEKSLGEKSATPENIKAYYEENKADFAQACVSHILVDDEAKAKDLKAQIDRGANFEELAKANSKDNQGATGGSAAQGGSLGCITQEESAGFVPEFVNGYKDLPTGQVSQPVKSSFGFHIIKVTERKEQTLEEATPAITQTLTRDTQAAFNDLLTATAGKAKIKVNPRYGRFDRQQLAVIPPEAPPAAGTPTTLPGMFVDPQTAPPQ